MTNPEKNELTEKLIFEKAIIKKYKKYVKTVNNPKIKDEFNRLISKHTKHYNHLLEQIER